MNKPYLPYGGGRANRAVITLVYTTEHAAILAADTGFRDGLAVRTYGIDTIKETDDGKFEIRADVWEARDPETDFAKDLLMRLARQTGAEGVVIS